MARGFFEEVVIEQLGERRPRDVRERRLRR
jgi:hypothetical protein